MRIESIQLFLGSLIHTLRFCGLLSPELRACWFLVCAPDCCSKLFCASDCCSTCFLFRRICFSFFLFCSQCEWPLTCMGLILFTMEVSVFSVFVHNGSRGLRLCCRRSSGSLAVPKEFCSRSVLPGFSACMLSCFVLFSV